MWLVYVRLRFPRHIRLSRLVPPGAHLAVLGYPLTHPMHILLGSFVPRSHLADIPYQSVVLRLPVHIGLFGLSAFLPTLRLVYVLLRFP